MKNYSIQVFAVSTELLSFLDEQDLGVDAVLWIGGTGYNGIEEVGKLLSGEVNPSGHLVDTYVNDSFSSPAMQNFGDYRYVDVNGELLGDNYNYVNYGEGIYVGYRYYETRYEDTVLGTANVGDYNYSEVVRFPFGYGLSYTDFSWSDYVLTDNLLVTFITGGVSMVIFFFEAGGEPAPAIGRNNGLTIMSLMDLPF